MRARAAWPNREVGNDSWLHDGGDVNDSTPDRDRNPRPDDAPDPEVEASVDAPTSDSSLKPEAGEAAPREPLVLRIWSGVELAVGVIRLLSSSSA